MNERIKSIWDEAAQLESNLFWAGQIRFMNKFAELIVLECLTKIENEAAQYAEPVWAVELVNDIKEHFGIEP